MKFADQRIGFGGGDVWRVIDKADDTGFSNFIASISDGGKKAQVTAGRIGSKITKAGGDAAKTLRYIEKDGKVIWLEKGKVSDANGPGSGWTHLIQEIRPGDTTTRYQQFVQSGLANSENGFKNLLMDIVKNGTEGIDSKGRRYITKSINGRNPQVFVGTNGYIVSAIP